MLNNKDQCPGSSRGITSGLGKAQVSVATPPVRVFYYGGVATNVSPSPSLLPPHGSVELRSDSRVSEQRSAADPHHTDTLFGLHITFSKTPFMVLTEDFTMSRTDEVHRITENVYKVKCNDPTVGTTYRSQVVMI